MVWCMRCGGMIFERGVSYGDEIKFCKCLGRKRKGRA